MTIKLALSIAGSRGVTVSDLVRDALKAYLEGIGFKSHYPFHEVELLLTCEEDYVDLIIPSVSLDELISTYIQVRRVLNSVWFREYHLRLYFKELVVDDTTEFDLIIRIPRIHPLKGFEVGLDKILDIASRLTRMLGIPKINESDVEECRRMIG